MTGLPYGEKNGDDMLSRFHLIPERHGRTDGRTDRRTELLYQYRASVCWRCRHFDDTVRDSTSVSSEHYIRGSPGCILISRYSNNSISTELLTSAAVSMQQHNWHAQRVATSSMIYSTSRVDMEFNWLVDDNHPKWAWSGDLAGGHEWREGVEGKLPWCHQLIDIHVPAKQPHAATGASW